MDPKSIEQIRKEMTEIEKEIASYERDYKECYAKGPQQGAICAISKKLPERREAMKKRVERLNDRIR